MMIFQKPWNMYVISRGPVVERLRRLHLRIRETSSEIRNIAIRSMLGISLVWLCIPIFTKSGFCVADEPAAQSSIEAELKWRQSIQRSYALLSPDRLRMVGGYRIPAAMLGKKTMAFSRCGLTGRHEADGRLRLWMPHHAGTTAVAEFIAPVSRGTDLTNIKNWPICEHVRNINRVYAELRSLDNACQIQGVHWSAERDRLLVSGRSIYNTTYNKSKWLVQVDVGDTPVIEAAIAPRLPNQAFGGGFVDIPKDFANKYCRGNTIGLAKGGYESGQASATSPTIAAYGDAPPTVLMHCKWNAPKEERERRDDNYASGSVSWQPASVNGVGFFGVDRVQDTAWVHTAELSSFIAIVLQPVGKLSYALQNDVFSNKKKYTLYVYDPADLAKVATGELLEHEVRGKWYPLPIEVPSLRRPAGLWWDKTSKLLNIVYSHAWKRGGPESYPVVVSYEIMAK